MLSPAPFHSGRGLPARRGRLSYANNAYLIIIGISDPQELEKRVTHSNSLLFSNRRLLAGAVFLHLHKMPPV